MTEFIFDWTTPLSVTFNIVHVVTSRLVDSEIYLQWRNPYHFPCRARMTQTCFLPSPSWGETCCGSCGSCGTLGPAWGTCRYEQPGRPLYPVFRTRWAYGMGWGRGRAGGRHACGQTPSCCPWRCCLLHRQPLCTVPPGPGSVWSAACPHPPGSQCSVHLSKWRWERSCSKPPQAKDRQRERDGC